MSKKLWLSLVAVVFCGSGILHAQTVDPARGADPKVDYEALKSVGPWDDRNYALKVEDLELLSANENEQRTPVPAFFRVELRRKYPDLPTTGVHQYPRSTLPRFWVLHGGLLIDGQLYRSGKRTPTGFEVDLSRPWMSQEAWNQKQGEIGEVRLGPGAETAVAINPVNTDLVIAGSNGPGGQVMYYSSDGGANWNSAGSLPQACCDPTVAWSSDGTRAYTVTLHNSNGNDVYLSTDNGQSWGFLEKVGSGFVDKEYLHADTFATSPHLDNLYLTWHLNGVMQFSRSTNQGTDWSDPIDLSVGSAQLGIGSDITSDKNGHIYYIWPTFDNGMTWLRKSTDGGTTFEPAVLVADTVGSYDFPIPAMSNRLAFMYVSLDTDLTSGPYANTIYVAYTDNTVPDSNNPAENHARIQVAYSRDGGDTWTITTPHETADSDTVDRFHPWLKVGPDGKVWVVFYDTRNGDRTTVDFYYSMSENGAQTWSAPERLTTVTSPKPSDDFEWGDYNGMDLVVDELIGIYTDNRNEGGGSGDSVDVYVVGTMAAPLEPIIFVDGFESGDTSAWTTTTTR